MSISPEEWRALTGAMPKPVELPPILQQIEEQDRRNQRRRFAEAALPAILREQRYVAPFELAKQCWRIADAMLEAESE